MQTPEETTIELNFQVNECRYTNPDAVNKKSTKMSCFKYRRRDSMDSNVWFCVVVLIASSTISNAANSSSTSSNFNLSMVPTVSSSGLHSSFQEATVNASGSFSTTASSNFGLGPTTSTAMSSSHGLSSKTETSMLQDSVSNTMLSSVVTSLIAASQSSNASVSILQSTANLNATAGLQASTLTSHVLSSNSTSAVVSEVRTLSASSKQLRTSDLSTTSSSLLLGSQSVNATLSIARTHTTSSTSVILDKSVLSSSLTTVVVSSTANESSHAVVSSNFVPMSSHPTESINKTQVAAVSTTAVSSMINQSSHATVTSNLSVSHATQTVGGFHSVNASSPSHVNQSTHEVTMVLSKTSEGIQATISGVMSGATATTHGAVTVASTTSEGIHTSTQGVLSNATVTGSLSVSHETRSVGGGSMNSSSIPSPNGNQSTHGTVTVASTTFEGVQTTTRGDVSSHATVTDNLSVSHVTRSVGGVSVNASLSPSGNQSMHGMTTVVSTSSEGIVTATRGLSKETVSTSVQPFATSTRAPTISSSSLESKSSDTTQSQLPSAALSSRGSSSDPLSAIQATTMAPSVQSSGIPLHTSPAASKEQLSSSIVATASLSVMATTSVRESVFTTAAISEEASGSVSRAAMSSSELTASSNVIGQSTLTAVPPVSSITASQSPSSSSTKDAFIVTSYSTPCYIHYVVEKTVLPVATANHSLIPGTTIPKVTLDIGSATSVHTGLPTVTVTHTAIMTSKGSDTSKSQAQVSTVVLPSSSLMSVSQQTAQQSPVLSVSMAAHSSVTSLSSVPATIIDAFSTNTQKSQETLSMLPSVSSPGVSVEKPRSQSTSSSVDITDISLSSHQNVASSLALSSKQSEQVPLTSTTENIPLVSSSSQTVHASLHLSTLVGMVGSTPTTAGVPVISTSTQTLNSSVSGESLAAQSSFIPTVPSMSPILPSSSVKMSLKQESSSAVTPGLTMMPGSPVPSSFIPTVASVSSTEKSVSVIIPSSSVQVSIKQEGSSAVSPSLSVMPGSPVSSTGAVTGVASSLHSQNTSVAIPTTSFAIESGSHLMSTASVTGVAPSAHSPNTTKVGSASVDFQIPSSAAPNMTEFASLVQSQSSVHVDGSASVSNASLSGSHLTTDVAPKASSSSMQVQAGSLSGGQQLISAKPNATVASTNSTVSAVIPSSSPEVAATESSQLLSVTASQTVTHGVSSREVLATASGDLSASSMASHLVTTSNGSIQVSTMVGSPQPTSFVVESSKVASVVSTVETVQASVAVQGSVNATTSSHMQTKPFSSTQAVSVSAGGQGQPSLPSSQSGTASLVGVSSLAAQPSSSHADNKTTGSVTSNSLMFATSSEKPLPSPSSTVEKSSPAMFPPPAKRRRRRAVDLANNSTSSHLLSNASPSLSVSISGDISTARVSSMTSLGVQSASSPTVTAGPSVTSFAVIQSSSQVVLTLSKPTVVDSASQTPPLSVSIISSGDASISHASVPAATPISSGQVQSENVTTLQTLPLTGSSSSRTLSIEASASSHDSLTSDIGTPNISSSSPAPGQTVTPANTNGSSSTTPAPVTHSSELGSLSSPTLSMNTSQGITASSVVHSLFEGSVKVSSSSPPSVPVTGDSATTTVHVSPSQEVKTSQSHGASLEMSPSVVLQSVNATASLKPAVNASSTLVDGVQSSSFGGQSSIPLVSQSVKTVNGSTIVSLPVGPETVSLVSGSVQSSVTPSFQHNQTAVITSTELQPSGTSVNVQESSSQVLVTSTVLDNQTVTFVASSTGASKSAGGLNNSMLNVASSSVDMLQSSTVLDNSSSPVASLSVEVLSTVSHSSTSTVASSLSEPSLGSQSSTFQVVVPSASPKVSPGIVQTSLTHPPVIPSGTISSLSVEVLSTVLHSSTSIIASSSLEPSPGSRSSTFQVVVPSASPAVSPGIVQTSLTHQPVIPSGAISSSSLSSSGRSLPSSLGVSSVPSGNASVLSTTQQSLATMTTSVGRTMSLSSMVDSRTTSSDQLSHIVEMTTPGLTVTSPTPSLTSVRQTVASSQAKGPPLVTISSLGICYVVYTTRIVQPTVVPTLVSTVATVAFNTTSIQVLPTSSVNSTSVQVSPTSPVNTSSTQTSQVVSTVGNVTVQPSSTVIAVHSSSAFSPVASSFVDVPGSSVMLPSSRVPSVIVSKSRESTASSSQSSTEVTPSIPEVATSIPLTSAVISETASVSSSSATVSEAPTSERITPTTSSSSVASSSVPIIPTQIPIEEALMRAAFKVPSGQNIQSEPFKANLEAKLVDAYRLGESLSSKRRRRVTESVNVTVENTERVDNAGKVDVSFFVTKNSQRLRGVDAVKLYDALTILQLETATSYKVIQRPVALVAPTSQPPPSNALVSMIIKDSVTNNISVPENKQNLENKLAEYYKMKKGLDSNVKMTITTIIHELNEVVYLEFFATENNKTVDRALVVRTFEVSNVNILTANLGVQVLVQVYIPDSLTASESDQVIIGIAVNDSQDLQDSAFRSDVADKLAQVYQSAKGRTSSRRKRRAVGSISATILNATKADAREANVIFFIFDAGKVASASQVVSVMNRLSTNEMSFISAPYAILSSPRPAYVEPATNPPTVAATTIQWWIIVVVVCSVLLIVVIILLIWWRWKKGAPKTKVQPESSTMLETRRKPVQGFDVARRTETEVAAMKTTSFMTPAPRTIEDEKPMKRETSLRRKVAKPPPQRIPAREQQAQRNAVYEESEEEDDESMTSVTARGSMEELVRKTKMKKKPPRAPTKVPVKPPQAADPLEDETEDDSEESEEETESEPERTTRARPQQVNHSAAQVPTVAVTSEASGPPRYPPVRFRSSVHPAPSLPPLDSKHQSLVGVRVEPPSEDDAPKRRRKQQLTKKELGQRADLERQKNKQRLRDRKRDTYDMTRPERNWDRAQRAIDDVLEEDDAEPIIRGKKPKSRRHQKRPPSSTLATEEEDAPQLKSYKKLKSPKTVSSSSHPDRGQTKEKSSDSVTNASSDESEIDMNETRRRMHMLLDNAFSLFGPTLSKMAQEPEGKPEFPPEESVARPVPAPRYLTGQPALPEPPPAHGRATEPTPRQRRRVPTSAHGYPAGMPQTPIGVPGYPVRTPERPVVTRDPVVVWDPAERQRMLNQRAPPPTYAYRDPSGQNVYITPVAQQRDDMGGLVWSPYAAEDTMDAIYPDIAQANYPGALSNSPPKHSSFLSQLQGSPHDTVLNMSGIDVGDQRRTSLGQSPQPLIRSIKDELFRLSQGATRKTPIKEI